MSCYRTILVALDSSPDAQEALRHAATLARDQHARLVVLTVVPQPALQLAGVTGAAAPDLDAWFARALHDAAGGLPEDVSVETRLSRGRPAKRILEVAEETRCDLIVMGFHGHGRLHGALIGSVSGTVLRESRRPVLLMRAAPGALPAQAVID